MENNLKTLIINGERVSVYTSPRKTRAALIRYANAPQFRRVTDCYAHPSCEKVRAELEIFDRIRRNTSTTVDSEYTVLSFNTFNFTAGYFLDAIDPSPRHGSSRIVLCIETSRYRYHYDVTDIL